MSEADRGRNEPTVAGVDGCRGGWIVVVAAVDGPALRLRSTHVAPVFADVLALTAACEAVAVDMPVGLSEDGQREADTLARRFIGARRSSVFPPPARRVIEAEGDYAALNALSKRIRGGLSRQTYNLMPKMREVDGCMTPALQRRVRESHPEVSFCALKRSVLLYAKRRSDGRSERLALLEAVFGPAMRDLRPPAGAAFDDLYDAAVLAWTAGRIARGEARSLPEQPRLDARGLRMEIVY